MIKKIVAWIFGLYTEEEKIAAEKRYVNKTLEERRRYYQKVLDELHRSGSLLPNTDLKMPKQSIIMEDSKTGEVIAEEGKWKKLPMDGQVLKVSYKKEA